MLHRFENKKSKNESYVAKCHEWKQTFAKFRQMFTIFVVRILHRQKFRDFSNIDSKITIFSAILKSAESVIKMLGTYVTKEAS